MAVATVNFTTGPSTLPDIGKLRYSGCVFSPLFETKESGKVVQDEAKRTTKYMQYTLTVDGYVTLPAGATDVNGTMNNLRHLLTVHGGDLEYLGRGFDLLVNSQTRDVAWGPVPKLLDFQPLGGGLSAKVRWEVTVCLPEVTGGTIFAAQGGGLGSRLLQLNFDTAVGYSEDGFSNLTIQGTLEIPLTRGNGQRDRDVPTTADSFRRLIANRILTGVDLSRFRVTNREFHTSRDKRTLEWSFKLEEKPYMDLPPACTIARGTYTVRPAKAGMGMMNWICGLKATYTLRADAPRKLAWYAFLALLRLRMAQSLAGNIPDLAGNNQNPPPGGAGAGFGDGMFGTAFGIFLPLPRPQPTIAPEDCRRPFLIDFSFDEGLYLDSKTVSFSAAWKIITSFSHILLASGLWTKTPETDVNGRNLWETSMRNLPGARAQNVMGTQSWLPNLLDPDLDIIVDFGSTSV